MQPKMQVNWKTDTARPILFLNRAHWAGLHLKHCRVTPGSLVDFVPQHHELNITLDGAVQTTKQSAGGRIMRHSEGAGQMCLTSAGQTFSAEWDTEYEYVALDLEPEYMVQTAIENRFSPRFELAENFAGNDQLIQQIGYALLKESQAGNPSGSLYADSLTQSLTLHLLKNYSTASYAAHTSENLNGGLPGYKLNKVTDFINDKLDHDLSLAEMATVAGLSRFHFARAFRRSTGITPLQYLMRRRVERAKELLQNRDLPLAQIGLLAGFKNQSHFTTLFRKFTSLTPKAWRELKLA
jgi:AraC family transcriptional regulator